MKNLPQIFNYKGMSVRTVVKDGEPWFVLKDVCDVLGLRSPDVKQRLSDDVVSTHTVKDALGRDNTASIVNEDGLYDVILESRKPEAKAFRKWVTSEVLPTIRKTGSYSINQVPNEVSTYLEMSEEDRAIAYFQERKEKKQLEAQILLQAPKVAFAESLETSSDSILIGELAKLLKQNGIDIGQNRLFQRLRDEGFLGRRGEYYNIPTQRAMEMRLFEIKTTTINTPEGETRVKRTPKVTGRGQLYFINKFRGALKTS